MLSVVDIFEVQPDTVQGLGGLGLYAETEKGVVQQAAHQKFE